jgi:hypothetical protein
VNQHRVIRQTPLDYLALMLSVSLLTAQDRAPQPGDPAILQIKVTEGEAAVYAVGSRATQGITIQVTDETGRPVDGATIAFRLPEEGPSGVFANASKTEIATTRPDGRAAAWGMQWNRTAGLLEVRITASKGQTRAGIVCAQYLTNAPDAAAAKTRMSSGGGHKWLWIAVGVAGAAGGALAAAAVGAKASTTAAPSTGVQIGTPTIILGRP